MQPRASKDSRVVIWACCAVAALTALLYLPSLWHDFTGYDDPLYVEIAAVRRGLTPQGVVWAFKMGPGHAANWHPVTWLSHMLDSQMFGRRPGPQHAVNVLIHALAAATLLIALWRMSGALWPSTLVALLFAWHPLHVQSVVWIAERKDVLSALFFFLALWAYAEYARERSALRYALVALCMTLGLLAKSMMVTFPFVLMLVDCLPLKWRARAGEDRDDTGRDDPRRWGRLIVEKIPLIVIAGVVAALTMIAQGEAGAVKGDSLYPLTARVGNAIVSYVRYLAKTVAPIDLAIFYPYRFWAAWQVGICAVVLLAITALCIWQRRRRFLMVGWLWFLGMLVPVIGLVQVGGQSMADRYTYLPLIGIFIMVAWGAEEWIDRSTLEEARLPRSGRVAADPPSAPNEPDRRGPSRRRTIASIVAGAVLIALAVDTAIQIHYWRDDLSLFSHALAVTNDNWLAHGYVGKAYALRREDGLAQEHYEAALALNKNYYEVYFNYANLMLRHGQAERAEELYRRAIALKPAFAEAYNNLGALLVSQSRLAEAEAAFAEAVRADPEYADAQCNLGRVMLDQGRASQAIGHFERAIALQPDFPRARRGLEQAKALVNPS
jgi:tetratricopeptide (TPR) repeat protein